MTTARIETVMTYKQWKRRFFKEVIQWSIAAVFVIGFFALMFLYWLKFGYIL